MEQIKQHWQNLNEWQKIVITICITLLIFWSFSNNHSSSQIIVNKDNLPIIINPETGKPVIPKSCKPNSDTNLIGSLVGDKPCQIFTEEYKQQERIVIDLHRKKGSTICCMTTYLGGEVFESCFKTSYNLPRCPGPYVKQ